MKIQKVVAIGFGTACLLLATSETEQAEAKQKVQISNTERMDFPPGGTLRLTNSVGMLTMEAWSRPDIEITTIKSTKIEYDAREREKKTRELDNVHVSAERRGDEVVVTTDFPRYRDFPPPFRPAGEINFDLEYHIKVPSNARIIANHDLGDVNVDGVAGDIQVTLLQGTITLHLPEEEQYDIRAKVDFGHVNSDFPGQQKRRRWIVGHQSVNEDSAAAHKLNLKVGFGDIVILRTRVPKRPEPLIPAPKGDGL
jgi:hypothetical protein